MLAEPVGLRIDVTTAADTAVLRLYGEIDADSAALLVEDAARVVQEGHRQLVLDCADVTFCDSFGLRAMAMLADQVQPDGSLTVTQPSEMLTRILDITGLAERLGLPQGPR